ncbi:MAG: hypothetical protein HPY84_17295 [Syntrophobacteraceae bacterium]|nr:hypothetical protein [Syntrophobacteraceae bacterium]
MLYEKKGRYIVEFPDIPTARGHQIELKVEDRVDNYKEVELGFDEQRAVKEAKRCLSCRRCLGCALCWAECKPEAINFEMEDELFDLDADTVILAPGVERPIDRIDGRFGLGRELNVITDLQLERMLSDSGPSSGLVIRPLDGRIPSSVAFVQSYPSAAPSMHAAALCLALNEAILVRRKLGDARIRVIARDMDAFLEEHRNSVHELDGIQVSQGEVSSVEAGSEGNLRLVTVENGTENTHVFDLVVLITQPQVSGDLKNLSRSLGLSLGYAAFLSGETTGLLSTEKEAVKLAAPYRS